MLDEHARRHGAKGARRLLAAVPLEVSVVAWRRHRRWYNVLTAVPAVAALIVVAANVSTVADPTRASCCSCRNRTSSSSD
jgi:hypothetical protein